MNMQRGSAGLSILNTPHWIVHSGVAGVLCIFCAVPFVAAVRVVDRRTDLSCGRWDFLRPHSPAK